MLHSTIPPVVDAVSDSLSPSDSVPVSDSLPPDVVVVVVVPESDSVSDSESEPVSVLVAVVVVAPVVDSPSVVVEVVESLVSLEP